MLHSEGAFVVRPFVTQNGHFGMQH